MAVIPSYGLEGPKCLAPKHTVNCRIRSQSHIFLTLDLKKPLSFSLQNKQCVEETIGEDPAQQGEGSKVEMESWQKECDSLRKVTERCNGVGLEEREDCV